MKIKRRKGHDMKLVNRKYDVTIYYHNHANIQAESYKNIDEFNFSEKDSMYIMKKDIHGLQSEEIMIPYPIIKKIIKVIKDTPLNPEGE